MIQNEEFSIVHTTVDNETTAEKLAASLVSEGLAACVQISRIRSFYSWEGKLNREDEFLLLVKTRKILYKSVEKFILLNHPYETPEIIMIPISDGYDAYFNWIAQIHPSR